MAEPQVQIELSDTPQPGTQPRVPAEVEPRHSSRPSTLEDLNRRAKELLHTIADAQSLLMKTNYEFSVVFRQIYAQLPSRKSTRGKKYVSAPQNIYEWSEVAEEQTGAQIHWKAMIKQLKKQPEQKGRDSRFTPPVENDHGKC